MAQADHEAAARAAARAEGIPEDLFVRLVGAESGWNPRAVSSAGAQGLTQLMPGTAAGLGVRDPFDPAQNLRGGARYLRQQFDRFGRWDLALAAYNAGPAKAEEALGSYSAAYVARILGATDPSARASTPEPVRQQPLRIGEGARDHAARALGDWQSDQAYDLMGSGGQTILSPVAGRVVRISGQPGGSPQFAGYGVTVEVAGGGSLFFKHLGTKAVKVGDPVRVGQPIGTLDPSTQGGPHLHLGADSLPLLERVKGLYARGAITGDGSIPTGPGGFPIGGGGIPADMQPGNNIFDKVPNPLNAVGDFLAGGLVKVLTFLLLGVVGVWLIGQGASRAFGTPAPAAIVKSATPGA